MRDAERLGVRNWRSKAKDRDGWRRLLESGQDPAWVVAPGSESVFSFFLNECPT